MEFKSVKGKIQCILYVLYVVTISTVLSQPPPPDVPLNEDIVNLDSNLTKTTPSVVTANGNDVTKLPTCPDLICTLEFIPEHCRVNPVLDRNGVKCTGCGQWKNTCKDIQNRNLDVMPPEVTCPKLTCPNITIPIKCFYVETYEYMGKVCEKCPVHRTGCVPDSMPSQEMTQCPVQACDLQLIPDECREIPTFEHNGLKCKGCPRRRQGCEPISGNAPVPRVSCPLMACDTRVPKECRVKREFQYRGRMCTQCPGWREGCREQERLNAVKRPNDNQRIRTQVPCPKFPCVDNNIPAECTIEQPYDFRGRTCYKCPIRNPECNPDAGQRNIPELPSCPLMNCERAADIPLSCYQREFFNYRGNMCEKCPSIKLDCLQFVPPRPNVQIDPAMENRIGIPEKSCPMLKCAFVDIPPNCKETPLYPHNGKMCQGCPRARKGCVSSLTQLPPRPNIDFPQIPEPVPDVACPVKACPFIYIPAECKVEQPYQYKGKTCYDCPKQREGCVPTNARPQNVQQMQCPMFGCPMIYIPPECRIERPFQFRGKTCYRCPQWREGCVPLPPKPTININNPVIDPLTTTESPKSVPTKQNIPEKSCPLMGCTKIYIPPQCREEQAYNYNGRVCYKCPKWKDGCLGRENKIETTTAVPSNSLDNTNILRQRDSPSITDLKEIIPVRDIINTVNAASCPPLRCPAMFIPLNCREDSVYQFQGRTCKGCPTWRLGCYPMSGEQMNMNVNGILSFSLFNELLSL